MKKTKRLWLLSMIVVALLALALAACDPAADDDDDDNDPDSAPKYTISFNLDGGKIDGAATVANQEKAENATVTNPGNPVKDEYVFDGWYNGATKWNFSTDKVGTSNITLTAKYNLDVDMLYGMWQYTPDDEDEMLTFVFAFSDDMLYGFYADFVGFDLEVLQGLDYDSTEYLLIAYVKGDDTEEPDLENRGGYLIDVAEIEAEGNVVTLNAVDQEFQPVEVVLTYGKGEGKWDRTLDVAIEGVDVCTLDKHIETDIIYMLDRDNWVNEDGVLLGFRINVDEITAFYYPDGIAGDFEEYVMATDDAEINGYDIVLDFDDAVITIQYMDVRNGPKLKITVDDEYLGEFEWFFATTESLVLGMTGMWYDEVDGYVILVEATDEEDEYCVTVLGNKGVFTNVFNLEDLQMGIEGFVRFEFHVEDVDGNSYDLAMDVYAPFAGKVYVDGAPHLTDSKFFSKVTDVETDMSELDGEWAAELDLGYGASADMAIVIADGVLEMEMTATVPIPGSDDIVINCTYRIVEAPAGFILILEEIVFADTELEMFGLEAGYIYYDDDEECLALRLGWFDIMEMGEVAAD